MASPTSHRAWLQGFGRSVAGPAVFFGVVALLTVMLSLAPGAPAPVWVLLRSAAVIFIVAAFALYAVLLNRRHQPVRRSLSEDFATLESASFLTAATLVTVGVFVIVPLLGAAIWSLYGCGGKISGALCA